MDHDPKPPEKRGKLRSLYLDRVTLRRHKHIDDFRQSLSLLERDSSDRVSARHRAQSLPKAATMIR